jgi:hypothetical protein
MHAYLDPAAAIQDAIDYVEGHGSGSYWKTRPGEDATGLPAMDENQRAGLDYARRVFGIGQ